MAWRCCKAHTCDEAGHCIGDMTWSHVIKVEKIKTRLGSMESCDQGGEDQDKTWLEGPVASVKGKLSDDLTSMDREVQVKSRSMNQYGHMMI